MTDPVLALDIGGTKFAAAVVDPTGRAISARRVPTPHAGGIDGEGLWATLTSLLDTVMRGVERIGGVGAGGGGPMLWPSGEISPLNIAPWRVFPLRARLRERYPDVPVRVHNDAVCVAVGEHWRGAGRGVGNLLGMVVSTGVGGGLVLGGRLIDGASGNAGHIGHVVADPGGPQCECGGVGCLEAIARGPAIVRWAQQGGWRRDRAGLTARDVADDASRGDAVARAAFERAGRAIGVALASAAALCDVEVVAIGGGVAQAGPLLFGPLNAAYAAHARLDFVRQVRIVPAALGQDAGLIGAAALVLAGDRYWNAD
ncbi:MAG: ROK family protein [Actinomycetes bacterium]